MENANVFGRKNKKVLITKVKYNQWVDLISLSFGVAILVYAFMLANSRGLIPWS